MAACLHDRDPVLRRHTLLLMTHLLQRDYIRLRPGVFYRLAAVLADSVQELRDHAEYVLSDMFLIKQPKLFLNNFLQTVLVLTGNDSHEGYRQVLDEHLVDGSMNDPDLDLKFFRGTEGSFKRKKIYKTLLRSMTNEHKLELMSKMCREVLSQMPHGTIKLTPLPGDETTKSGKDSILSRQEETVRDVFYILSTPEIKVNGLGRTNALGRAEAAAADDSEIVAAVQLAKGTYKSDAVSKCSL